MSFTYDCVRKGKHYYKTYLLVSLLSYCRILFIMCAAQQPLQILAFGASLTAGYYNYGQDYHPYAKHLAQLFQLANIPVQIYVQGVSGERVVPSMVERLRSLLEQVALCDWIIIQGGTNDLGHGLPAEKIFKEGLQPMYEMCLNHTSAKTKLAIMTIIENTHYSPTDDGDKNRQALNSMIRDYVAEASDQNRISLVDLDKGISYHAIKDRSDSQKMWDDVIHLTPAGYDRMATLVFDAIKNKL